MSVGRGRLTGFGTVVGLAATLGAELAARLGGSLPDPPLDAAWQAPTTNAMAPKAVIASLVDRCMRIILLV